MSPEQEPTPKIPRALRRAWVEFRGQMDKFLGVTSAATLLEDVLTPEIDLEKIPLTDRPLEDGLFFDSISGDVIRGDQVLLRLTPLRRRLFGALVTNADQTMRYPDLMLAGYPDEAGYLVGIGSNRVRFEMKRLQRAVEKTRQDLETVFSGFSDRLENIKEVGYRWRTREREQQSSFGS